jgi:hypothetical protein
MLNLLIRGATLLVQLTLFKLALKSALALIESTRQWLASRHHSDGGV